MGDAVQAVMTGDARGAMLVAADKAAAFSADWFDARRAAAEGRVVGTAGGRGTVLFLDAGDAQWVLRHYRRGGLVGRFNRDLYLWTGAERTRAFREFRLLQTLHGLQLPVPLAVAARYQRHGLFYRADIITRRIDNAQSWSARLTEAGEQSAADEWQAVGACLRRFHDAGVYHADLNAHNIMVDDRGAVFVIDFDRGAVRTPGSWKQANLERLARSLRKISAQCSVPFFSQQSWRSLLEAYAA